MDLLDGEDHVRSDQRRRNQRPQNVRKQLIAYGDERIGDARKNEDQGEAIAAHHPCLVQVDAATADADQCHQGAKQPQAALEPLLDVNLDRLKRSGSDVDRNRRGHADGGDIDFADCTMKCGPGTPQAARKLSHAESECRGAGEAVHQQQPFDRFDVLPMRIRGIEQEALVRRQCDDRGQPHQGEERPLKTVGRGDLPLRRHCHLPRQ